MPRSQIASQFHHGESRISQHARQCLGIRVRQGFGSQCTTCARPDVDEINAAIRAGIETYGRIGARYGIKTDTLSKHARRCLGIYRTRIVELDGEAAPTSAVLPGYRCPGFPDYCPVCPMAENVPCAPTWADQHCPQLRGRCAYASVCPCGNPALRPPDLRERVSAFRAKQKRLAAERSSWRRRYGPSHKLRSAYGYGQSDRRHRGLSRSSSREA